MSNPNETAVVDALITAVKISLLAGVRFYDREGRLLPTPSDVFRCFNTEGAVRAVDAAGQPVTQRFYKYLATWVEKSRI